MTPTEKADALAYQRGDSEAAGRLLVASAGLLHRLVWRFSRAGVSRDELLQEARMGFLEGVLKWDPERGFRVATYALWWSRARVYDHCRRHGLRTGVATFGTSKVERMLLFQSSQARRKAQLLGAEQPGPEALAARFGVPLERVRAALGFLGRGRDVSLDAAPDEEHPDRAVRDLATAGNVEEAIDAARSRAHVRAAVATLGERERAIITRRYLTDEPETLQDIGQDWGLSRERIRQLEARAMGTLKARLRRSA